MERKGIIIGIMSIIIIISGCLGIGYIEGEVVIVFKEGVDKSIVNETLQKYNLTVKWDRSDSENDYYSYIVEVSDGKENEYIEMLEGDPNIESATKNYYK